MKTTLEEMQAFRAVVDSGSITAAAEHLGQTTSGVSRTLGRLEEKLDTTLLRRTTRRLALTEEGEAFLAHVRTILGAVDDAEDNMSRRRQMPAGRLRINSATSFMLHSVVPLVGAFRAHYPAIELELHTNEHIIDLLERDTDLAIRIGPLRDSTLRARPLGITRRRLLASPAYLATRGQPADVAALADHTLLGFHQPESLNDWPLRHDKGDLLSVRPSIVACSGETLRLLALAGEGIACLSDFMTERDRASGQLVEVLPQATVDNRQAIHAVYYRNTQLAARIGCFIDFLADGLLQPGSGIVAP
ncbi:MAG: LysR family transcriptional regulator [Rhodocyclaceae bacterium]